MSKSAELPERKNFVRVGRVARPHGIKGELKILPHGEPGDFENFPELLVGAHEQPVGRLYKVERLRPQDKTVLVVLTGIPDRSAAELLIGREVWVDEKYLPALAEDEFYWHELVGLRVVVEGGRELGEVTAMLGTGGHDLLVVHGGGKEYLIPARREFMLDTDRQAGVIIVADIPGLFDLND